MSFLQDLAGWDESQHPRAKDGQFTDSGGGGKPSKADKLVKQWSDANKRASDTLKSIRAGKPRPGNQSDKYVKQWSDAQKRASATLKDIQANKLTPVHVTYGTHKPDNEVDRIKGVLGDHSELADTWIKATMDDDEGAFAKMSDAQIRNKFKKYAKGADVTWSTAYSNPNRLRQEWNKVSKLRGEGRHHEAAKLEKKLRGLEDIPMSETYIAAAEAFKTLIGPGHVHSDKWHRCWVKVQGQGHSSDSAAAICTKSLGEDSFDRAAEALLSDEPLEREVHLRAALGAPLRREMYDGREHLVVPVVALMEGVIHAVNAPEPEFVPVSALAASVSSWNGRPVVLGHPTKDGRQISANDPRTLEAHRFGTIFTTRMNGSRLCMEAWVDPVKLESLDKELYGRVLNGQPIEVSVGAHVRTAMAPGSHGGRPYKIAWRELMSDHLAFLPKTRGACSIEMGCGALRAAEGEPEYEIYQLSAEDNEPELDDRELEELVDDLRTAIGKRNNAKDQRMIQTVHDHAVELGATCGSNHRYAAKADEKETGDTEEQDCPMCDGSGEVDGKDCPKCGGSGTITTHRAASVWFRSGASMPDKAEIKQNGSGKTKEVDCPHCDGMGQIDGKDCPYCDGKGKVYRAASRWFTALAGAVKSLFLPSSIDWFDNPELLRTFRGARNVSQKERDAMKESDFAGKGTSFPINKPADVAAAAASLGRAGADNYSTDTIKANIIRIAKRKGAAYVAQLPASWKDEMK